MDILAIEESLAMLDKSNNTPSRSPLSVHTKRRGRERKASEEDIFEILKKEDVSKSPSQSSNDEDDEEDEDEEEDEEENEDEDEDEDKKEEEEEEEEDEEEDEDEDEDEEEVSVTSKRILPITPKKFTISTPRTPTERLQKKKQGTDKRTFLSKLKEFRYSILRVVHNENTLQYVVCFDPYGQIVFISCEDEVVDLKSIKDSVDVIKLIPCKETTDNPLDEAFVNAVKERVNLSVYGLIFYNGEDYQISERNSRGFFKDHFYKLKGKNDKQKLSFPQTFVIIQSEDVFSEPLLLIETNRENYESIKVQQEVSSRKTFSQISGSLKTLVETMENFETVYKRHSKGVVNDSRVMAKHSKKYYEKYSRQELDGDEKETYDLVSLNMFLRFQFFNQNIELMDRLHELKDYLDKADRILKKAVEEIDDKDENVRTKIVSREEINKYI